MVVTTISNEFTVRIPEPYRKLYGAGQDVAISADAEGRLVITPIEHVREVLRQTSGIWSDRTDLPRDSIEIIDELRKGTRLGDLGLAIDEGN